MKKKLLIVSLIVVFPILFAAVPIPAYVILGWNDLGMHCANKNFSKMAILPPYNNLMVQVIKKGDANTYPQVLTSDYKVSYEVPGNTYSDGKTNFWTYVNQLFGVSPAPNIGLTGAGLSGFMDTVDNHFQMKGIPITPYPDTDLINEHPYQLALMKAFDVNNNLLAETQNVIPVSNEINCVSSGCHSSEQDILDEHENTPGFNSNGPVFCASCHADNAMGTGGGSGAPIFSRAIHHKHRNLTSDCYKCHPGPNTQCFRDVMHAQGYTCTDCHGSMNTMYSSIDAGRQPWLNEPSCGASGCHDANHSEEPNKLFRESKGHGGLYCSACHGSPHAITPTNQANDNLQNITLQGFAGKLIECSVCHGITPTMPGPHGYMPVGINEVPGQNPSRNGISSIYPNPSSTGKIQLVFQVKDAGSYRLVIMDINGKQIAIVAHETLKTGNYSMEINTGNYAKGTYLARLSGGKVQDVKKFIVN